MTEAEKFVAFRTPGHLQIEAITVFGMSAKPNTDSPIGYFGTGLKHAIAVLVREGIEINLTIGDTEYEFYTKDKDFRGVEFSHVMMRKRKGFTRRWHSVQLPFTTEYSKNWNLWQAYRELHANTLDEKGYIFDHSGADHPDLVLGDYSEFRIGGDAFHEIYTERDTVFLPTTTKETCFENDSIRVYAEPSKYIYYRSMRAGELPKPSAYMYDIKSSIELTEDRTVKYMFMVESKLERFYARDASEELLDAVMDLDQEKFYEGTFDFDYMSETPSEAFRNAVEKREALHRSIPSRMGRYYSRYSIDPKPAETEPLADRLLSWAKSDSLNQFHGLNDLLMEAYNYVKET